MAAFENIDIVIRLHDNEVFIENNESERKENPFLKKKLKFRKRKRIFMVWNDYRKLVLPMEQERFNVFTT